MRFPDSEIGSTERTLGVDEIDELACTKTARRIAKKFYTDDTVMDLASEIVTTSDEFGAIYRYQIKWEANDDELAKKVMAVLVIWFEDYDSGCIAVHPLFELKGIRK